MNSASPLATLPAELLEHVCDQLLPSLKSDLPALIFPLRLTCRTIQCKIEDHFLKNAFGSRTVYNSHASSSRLLEMSRIPAIARAITTLTIDDHEQMIAFSHKHIQETLQDPSTSPTTRHRFERLLRDLDEERQQRVFHENSGLNAVLLSHALASLTSLQDIQIRPLFYDDHYRPDPLPEFAHPPCTTHFLCMAIACSSFTGRKLRSLKVLATMDGDVNVQGVSVEALAMPDRVFASLASLRDLDLLLRDSGISSDLPGAWISNLGTFLQHTPMLERLSLRLDESIAPKGYILLKSVNAHQLSFPRLRSLHLSGWACEGVDLIAFLQKYTTLQTLQLSDMNFISRIPYSWVLRQIANTLHLEEFRSWQIAERGFRTRFASLIDAHPACTKGEDGFVADFVLLSRASGYDLRVEAWEGVSRRLLELADDVAVTEKYYLRKEGIWLD